MEEKVTKRRGRVILPWSQRSKKDHASIKHVEKQHGGGEEEPNVSGKQPTRTNGIAEWVGVNIQKMDGGFHHRRLELLLQSSKKHLIVLFLPF